MAIFQIDLVEIESASFNEQAINVRSVVSASRYLFVVIKVQKLKAESKNIYRDQILPCISLQNRSQEPLREEEAAYPISLRVETAIKAEPISEKVNSLNHVVVERS